MPVSVINQEKSKAKGNSKPDKQPGLPILTDVLTNGRPKVRATGRVHHRVCKTCGQRIFSRGFSSGAFDYFDDPEYKNIHSCEKLLV